MRQPASNRDRDPLGNVQPPALTEGLRQQVLARARLAARDQATITDRLWESPALKLAWAATVVLLLGVQVYLASPAPEPVLLVATNRPDVSSLDEPELQLFLARYRVGQASSLSRLGGAQLFDSIVIDPFS